MKKMRKQFIKLLNIHGVSGEETKVRKYLQPILKDTMDNVIVDNYGNLLAEKTYGTGRGAVVMLSAHMDTVKGVLKDRKLVINGDIFTSDKGALGADDRGGIAIIMEVLRNLEKSKFDGTVKVAFSREEEIGCVGSRNIDPKWYENVDLAMVVDRRGSRDIVVGSWNAFCSNEVGTFLEEASKMLDMDWKACEGGISDACTFSEQGINAVNLSAGYYNEHTANEYADFSQMKDTVLLMLQAFAIINTFFTTFGNVPENNKWVVGYTKYYGSYGKKGYGSKSYGRSVDNYDNYYSYLEEKYGRDYIYADDETTFVEEDIYAEEKDMYGDVYIFETSEGVIIQQGKDEIVMSRTSLKSLFDQVRGVLK